MTTSTSTITNLPVPTCDKTAVRDAAATIHRYLTRNPSASDTVDGVARWWLSRQRRFDAEGTVEAALEWLEGQGFVTASMLANGARLYRLADGAVFVEGVEQDARESE